MIWNEDLGKYPKEELWEWGNHTNFEYEIGERITVDTNVPYKCYKKEVVNSKLYQYFVKGIVKVEFPY